PLSSSLYLWISRLPDSSRQPAPSALVLKEPRCYYFRVLAPRLPLSNVPRRSRRGTGSMMRPARASKPDGYLLGSYRIATAPEPNSSRLTSFKSTCFDSPANNVGPWPASLGCTTNSYSSISEPGPMIAAPVQCD